MFHLLTFSQLSSLILLLQLYGLGLMTCSNSELLFFLKVMNKWHLVGLLDEWPARHKASTYTEHNTETQRQTFQPTTPVTKRPFEPPSSLFEHVIHSTSKDSQFQGRDLNHGSQHTKQEYNVRFKCFRNVFFAVTGVNGRQWSSPTAQSSWLQWDMHIT
jgi:hypothetical protein